MRSLNIVAATVVVVAGLGRKRFDLQFSVIIPRLVMEIDDTAHTIRSNGGAETS